MEAQQTPLRTAIMRIMSDMLDNPCEHGLYDTGRFMDRIEQLLCDMMAAPEVMQLSGSEAVFGLLAWLTTRDETTVLGPHQQVDVSIATQFVEANRLAEPREAWHELLTHPKTEVPEIASLSSEVDFDIGKPECGSLRATLFDLNGKVVVTGSLEEVIGVLTEKKG